VTYKNGSQITLHGDHVTEIESENMIKSREIERIMIKREGPFMGQVPKCQQQKKIVEERVVEVFFLFR